MAFTAAEALELIRSARDHGRLGHAYLVTGPEGSGKRQLVSDFCAMLTGETENPLGQQDVHAIEPESRSRRIRVEQIRELERELHMRSFFGGPKIGIIHDADRLVEAAANAFLKTLEEPPANSHLLLVSSQPDQLLETILSRCIEIQLRPTHRLDLTAPQREWIDSLAAFSHVARPELPDIFGLVRALERLLAQAKEAINANSETELKKEELVYKQVGDTRGLEDREEFYKALTESRYLRERANFIALLEQFWADALRQQKGAPLELPEHAEAAATNASRFTTAELLARCAAFEELRDNLNRTGVVEALALECGFLKALG